MLLSIVTAVLNRADTIDQAVHSLQGQSWSNYEHVVQDGGSTDGTLERLRELGDGRMVLESGRDTGIYDALNRGFSRARGDVVGLLHSNDLLADPEVLSDVAATFADPRVDAVYGDLLYVARKDTSRVIRTWRSCPFEPALLRQGWMPPHPTLFLRRRVLERHALFDTSFRIAADYDLVLRYFRQPGFIAVHLSRVLVRMRQGGKQPLDRAHRHEIARGLPGAASEQRRRPGRAPAQEHEQDPAVHAGPEFCDLTAPRVSQPPPSA